MQSGYAQRPEEGLSRALLEVTVAFTYLYVHIRSTEAEAKAYNLKQNLGNTWKIK